MGICEQRQPLPELFVAAHRGRFILHAPLHATTCLINRSFFERVRAAQHGDRSTLPEVLGELARWGLDTPRSPETVSSATTTHPCEVSFLLTERCNLRCSYCYARGGEGNATLQLAAGAAAIDEIVDNAVATGADRITLHLHGGGEVSLVWSLAQRLIEHARQRAGAHSLGVRVTAGTNGVMARDQACEMAGSIDEATVSVDGLPSVHNRQRPTRSGHDSLEQVLRTLEVFTERGVAHGLRLTVTPESVDQLPDGVAFLCHHTSSKVLQAEPAEPLGRHATRPPLDPHRFVEQLRVAREIAVEAGRELRYSGARYPQLTDVFCRAVTGALCVTTRGKVTACYEAGEDPTGRFTFGRYDATTGRLSIDRGRQRGLLRLSVHNRPGCDGCIAKYHCAGDCPMKRRSSTARDDDPYRCVINRALTADQILDDLDGRSTR